MLQAEPPVAVKRLRWLNPRRRGLGPIFVIAVLLLIISPSLAASQARVATVDGLNLRDGPSLTANVLTRLPYNAVVDILGAPTAEGWYPAASGGQQGYVDGAFLDFSPPSLQQGSAVVVPSDGLRLRVAPLSDAAVVMTLASGQVVTVTSDNAGNGWYQVQTPGGAGWVDGHFLQAVSSGSVPITIRWYGHEFDGGVLACGGVYSADDAGVAATVRWPCGTQLNVCYASACVNVVVRDRGHMDAGAIDLSAAAYQRLAPLATGALSGWLQVVPVAPATPAHP